MDSISRSFEVTVNSVNDAPTFVSGGNVTVNEDSDTYSNLWANQISTGPANESSQSVSFTVTNTRTNLFSIQPAVSPTGVLSFTPAPNANGSAMVIIKIRDNGGVMNGGLDTGAIRSFTITVNAINDPPVISGLANTTTKEDTTKTISFLVSDSLTAASALKESASSSNTSLVPNNVLLVSGLNGLRRLTITPAANAYGETTITLTVMDGDGASAVASFTLIVTTVNDAPVITGATYSANVGQVVSFRLNATDIDSDVQKLFYEKISFSGDGTIGGGKLSGQAPDLEFIAYTPGTYTLRYRVRDDAGALSNESVIDFVIKSAQWL